MASYYWIGRFGARAGIWTSAVVVRLTAADLMAAWRWRTTYKHPIVAPPAKQAAIDTVANTAAGMGDLAGDGRFTATTAILATN